MSFAYDAGNLFNAIRSMNCFRYESMVPEDLRNILASVPLAYLPIGPLEWHGEHLAYGCDPIRAAWLLENLWKEVGGVLLPTLYLGTDGVKRSGNVELWGMEMFAGEPLPGGTFLPADVFSAVVSHTLNFLERNGFRLCITCTGHQAPEQIQALEKLESEFQSRTMRVIAWQSGRIIKPDGTPDEIGHAGFEETSELMHIDPALIRPHRIGTAPADQKLGLTPSTLSQASATAGQQRLELEHRQLKTAVMKMCREIGLAILPTQV